MNDQVDLNCDLGESFGAYTMGNDEEIIDLITSANVACGFHAGDPSVMKKTVRMALQKGVGIGAHPGIPDLAGFGRRTMAISAEEAYDLTLYQIGALDAFVRAEGGEMQHVKAHGALYNMAAKDASLAEAIAEAVYAANPELILFGLSGSELVRAGEKIGLRTANEVFSDRTYQPDGTLTNRREPNALITDPDLAANQVVRMVKEGKVQTADQTDFALCADTVCIHGDGAAALEFARRLKDRLPEEGVKVEKIGSRFSRK
ncbi:LamB/YcsF family protein [Bhargavaea beijingensis]|uniref:5-oxoprolinase subunit A n=1 Tax=Bhargavaea beijingensis TaxID=426756 RepID=A0ABX9ZF33_9BACL|nr:5-oxoprolinase subunit PxpA [Bhargavaea beijingensis]RSK35655.1 LamB/YcsF family protein [Bhargavaea beijingensis]